MHMKQSPHQLHPQQFLSSSSSFYIMLHMCILCCVSSFEKKTYSEKYVTGFGKRDLIAHFKKIELLLP